MQRKSECDCQDNVARDEVYRAVDTRLGRAVAIKITRRADQPPFGALGARDFVTEPPQHLHALRRWTEPSGNGAGAERETIRNHRRLVRRAHLASDGGAEQCVIVASWNRGSHRPCQRCPDGLSW